MPQEHVERRTLSIPEAAAYLGIGRNTAYEAARTGEIPTIRIGGRIVVPELALERLLESAIPGGDTRSLSTDPGYKDAPE